jgi:Flp pilus assembly pilin Flp
MWDVYIRREIMTTFIKDESGATAIEYGMIIGFMAGLIAISWGSAFEGLTSTFNFISTAIAVA